MPSCGEKWHQRRHRAVGVERDVLRALVLALGEIEPDLLEIDPEHGRRQADATHVG
jgi:hypothetical protein